MYNYCCVFCERSLAIFKSLDLKPLKASMGVAGNNPVIPDWMPVFPGRSKPESFAALSVLTAPLLTGCGAVTLWKLTVEGREWLGLGLNLEPWLKWGAGLPSVQRFCSSLEVLPAMMSEGTRDFGVVLGGKYWTEFSFKMRI